MTSKFTITQSFTVTNCQTSYTEIHKCTLGILLDFNYIFLLETIQNFYRNINIQTLYSDIHFIELKTPKGGCVWKHFRVVNTTTDKQCPHWSQQQSNNRTKFLKGISLQAT